MNIIEESVVIAMDGSDKELFPFTNDVLENKVIGTTLVIKKK